MATGDHAVADSLLKNGYILVANWCPQGLQRWFSESGPQTEGEMCYILLCFVSLVGDGHG